MYNLTRHRAKPAALLRDWRACHCPHLLPSCREIKQMVCLMLGLRWLGFYFHLCAIPLDAIHHVGPVISTSVSTSTSARVAMPAPITYD